MGLGVRKGMLYNLLGLGISGIAIFLFNILAGRLLGPEKYGIVAVFYSSLVTVQTLIGGGFSFPSLLCNIFANFPYFKGSHHSKTI